MRSQKSVRRTSGSLPHPAQSRRERAEPSPPAGPGRASPARRMGVPRPAGRRRPSRCPPGRPLLLLARDCLGLRLPGLVLRARPRPRPHVAASRRRPVRATPGDLVRSPPSPPASCCWWPGRGWSGSPSATPALFAVNIAFARRRDERALVNDAVFVVECAAMVPVTWAVAAGGTTLAPPPLASVPAHVWVLTVAVALLLSGSTLHVKSLIRERADPRFARASRVVRVGLPARGSLGLAAWWGLPSGLLLVVPFAWFALRSMLLADPSSRPARHRHGRARRLRPPRARVRRGHGPRRPGMNGAGLDALSPATRAWFTGAFAGATPAQVGAWSAIAKGDDTLVVAPTGSGKTLAAFLHAIDRLMHDPVPDDRLRRCRVLYVSPLKALAVDVERNLRSPLVGIQREAARLGLEAADVTIGIRTGDTPPAERARLAKRPPDILITTPESLFLMLTVAGPRGPARRRHGHPRRGACDRRHQAWRPSGPVPRAARPAARPAGPADRPVGDRQPARDRRHVRPPVPAGDHRRAAEREAVGPADPGARRRHGRARCDDRDLRQRRRLRRPHVDLAAHRRAARRPHRAAPHDPGLRQQPPPRRAHHGAGRTRSPSSRARRRGPARSAAHRPGAPRLGQQGAARPDRGRPEGGAAAGRRRDEQPRARHRHGDHRPRRPGRDPAQRRQRPAARRARGPPGRCRQPRHRLPQVPRRPRHVGRRHLPHARRPDRGPAHPAQPPRRARPADRRLRGHGRLDGRRPAGDGAPGRAVHRPDRRRPRLGARHALGSLPVGRVRRAPAPPGLGSRQRTADRPARRPATGGHQRRHDPRPRACSASSSSARAPRGSASSTRRWSTSPGSATSSPWAPRRGASRTSPTTGSSSRRHRASPGGCRSGTATRSAGRPSSAGPWARSSARSPRPATTPTSSAGTGMDARATANLRQYIARAARGDVRRAQRHHDRGGAVPRRARRLAGRGAHPVRRQGARAVGPGHRRAHPRRHGNRRARHARRRRHRPAPARRRRRGVRPLGDGPHQHRAGGGRGARHRGGRRVGAVRLALPRVRGARAAAASPPARPAHAAVAAAAAIGAPAGRRVGVRVLPDHPRDGPRVPAGRLRRARPARDPDGAARRAHPRPRGVDRAPVAVRAVAAVRLRRLLPVRGRLAARRATRPGPHPGSRPPRRAAGHARAARPARRRARSTRSRPSCSA